MKDHGRKDGCTPQQAGAFMGLTMIKLNQWPRGCAQSREGKSHPRCCVSHAGPAETV